MMVDEGFGGGDPKIRLAQLQEALLRDCRYVVGIKLHTQGMTVEDGAKVFVEKGFQEPANAYEEARRGAYNPTYLYYTLGKLEIQKLRDEYRRRRARACSSSTTPSWRRAACRFRSCARSCFGRRLCAPPPAPSSGRPARRIRAR